MRTFFRALWPRKIPSGNNFERLSKQTFQFNPILFQRTFSKYNQRNKSKSVWEKNGDSHTVFKIKLKKVSGLVELFL